MKEKKRLLQMLYSLSESDVPQRSADLAKLSGVSIRTIKSDIPELGALAVASGAELCSKKGTGFWLEITDPDTFVQVKEQLGYMFSSYSYTSEYENKVNVFARRLLVSDEYVTAQMLADELWLARSTIKPYISEVRTLLEKFHLKLESRASYGLKVSGLEVNKRFCMLELYINHDMRTQSLIGNRDFRDYFDLDSGDARLLRSIVLWQLRNSTVSIRDQMTHRLIRYIPLACNRSIRGYHAVIPEKVKELLEPLNLRPVARSIFSAVREVFPQMPQDEDEISALEYLLAVFLDPIGIDLSEEKYTVLRELIFPVIDTGLDAIGDKWSMPSEGRDMLKEQIIPVMVPISAQLLFPDISYSFIGKEIENNETSVSPLSVAIARDFLKSISLKYNCRISRYASMYLAITLFLPIYHLKYPLKKVRLLIGNRMGSYGSRILREALYFQFGPDVFEKIDFIELYEGRRVDVSGYDYMIGNYDELYFHYDLPYLRVSAVPSADDLNRVFEKVILKNYGIDSIAEKIHAEYVNLPEVPAFRKKEEFCLKTAGLFARDPGHIQALKEELMEVRDISIWEQTLFLITGTEHTGKNKISLWEYERGYEWENKFFHKVVFCSADFGKDRYRFKAVEQLTRMLCRDANFRLLKEECSDAAMTAVIQSAYCTE